MIFEIILTFCFPLLPIIPIVLKLVSLRIFSNIEFKTQTYRFFKINSIVDSLMLMTILFLPLTECQELCDRWWRNTYWLVFYKFCIILFINKSLRTINSFLVLTFAWNLLRDTNGSKVAGKGFILHLIIIIALSFFLHLPNIFLYKIALPLNCTIETQYEITYRLEYLTKNAIENISIIQYGLGVLLLVLTFGFCAVIAYKMVQLKKLRSKSIILISKRNSNVSNANPKTSVTYQCELFQSIIGNRVKTLNSSKTNLLRIFITVAFWFDLLVTTVSDGVMFFVIKHKFDYFIFIRVFYLLIIFTQSLHVFIYYKFNDAFFQRFNKTFLILKRTKSISSDDLKFN